MSDTPTKKENNIVNGDCDSPQLRSRREFLNSLGRWSAIVIGGAALGGVIAPTESAAWVNGGGAWVNARGGGGGWANRAGGGGAWANRAVGGGAWVNNRGGGGAWVNRRF